MDPAQGQESGGGKGLHPDAEAVKSPGPQCPQPILANGSRVCLDRDFSAGDDRETSPDRGEEPAEVPGGNHGRCAAPEVDGVDRCRGLFRKPLSEQIHLLHEQIEKLAGGAGGCRKRVEIAVGAFPHAERDMDVDSSHGFIFPQEEGFDNGCSAEQRGMPSREGGPVGRKNLSLG
jgi:hypothetical protein